MKMQLSKAGLYHLFLVLLLHLWKEDTWLPWS